MKGTNWLKKRVVIKIIDCICIFIRNVRINNPCALRFDGRHLTIFPIKTGTGDIKRVKSERKKMDKLVNKEITGLTTESMVKTTDLIHEFLQKVKTNCPYVLVYDGKNVMLIPNDLEKEDIKRIEVERR